MKSVIANDKITAKQVRLVDGETSAVVSLSVALDKAAQQSLDLVQVNEADVPVVKIMDLNKYKFEQQQNEKAAKKKQRAATTQVKEIQYTFETQENDLAVKAKQAAKFLSEGKHVRIVVKLPARLLSNAAMVERFNACIPSFLERLGEVDMIQPSQIQGKFVTCTVKAK